MIGERLLVGGVVECCDCGDDDVVVDFDVVVVKESWSLLLVVRPLEDCIFIGDVANRIGIEFVVDDAML